MDVGVIELGRKDLSYEDYVSLHSGGAIGGDADSARFPLGNRSGDAPARARKVRPRPYAPDRRGENPVPLAARALALTRGHIWMPPSRSEASEDLPPAVFHSPFEAKQSPTIPRNFLPRRLLGSACLKGFPARQSRRAAGARAVPRRRPAPNQPPDQKRARWLPPPHRKNGKTPEPRFSHGTDAESSNKPINTTKGIVLW